MQNRNDIHLSLDAPPSGCQFIAVERRHYTDADKCRLPQRAGSPYCPAHHAIAFMAAPDQRAVAVP